MTTTQRSSRPKGRFVPIEEVCVLISDYVEALAQYLVSGKWRDASEEAFLVVRNNEHGLYVFERRDFFRLAEEAESVIQVIRDSGLASDLQGKLADIFNIHETTPNEVVKPEEEPSEPLAAVYDGNAERTAGPWDSSKLRGVWLPPIKKRAINPRFLEPTEQGVRGTRSFSPRRNLTQMMGDTVAAAPPIAPAGSTATRATAAREKPETLRRTPHMDLSKEEPVLPGDKFEVSIYVDEMAARPGEVTEDVEILLPPKVRQVQVMVHLSVTEHFAIKGSQSGELVIKRDESRSGSVKFMLEVVAAPTSSRAGTIVAAFQYKGRPCGKVARSVTVASKSKTPDSDGKAPQTDQPAVSDTGGEGPHLEIVADAQQPDMTITILNPSNDQRNFDVTITTPLLEEYKQGVKGPWALNNSSSEIVNGYFEEFTEENITEELRRDALLGAGEELFSSTPAHFRKAFWQIIDAKLPLRSILVVSQEPFIPWELMIPSRTIQDKDEVRDALGVSYSIGRWVCNDNISPSQLLSIVESQVFAPDYKGREPAKLPNAQKEADFVRSQFNGQPISPAIYTVFNAAMATSTATLLHFVCHGAAQTPVAQQIYLEDGTTLSSVKLGGGATFRAACRKNKPFVFLNACEVGRPQPALVGVGGFAKTFIDRGACAVVAPLWSVKDDIAHDVAMEFYQTIAKEPKKPLAEILCQIRSKAYVDAAEDTYAAYCFYGDPLARRAAQ